MPSIKGTASVTDNRALHKRLASVKFPTNFNEKLDVEKIHRPVLTQWIEDKITELLGFEDEIVHSTAVNLFLPTRLEDGPKVQVDPKRSQIDLEGFLGEAAAAQFTTEVWDLLLDAQSSGVGVPRKLVEEKKKELEAQKAAASARRPVRDGRPHGHGGGPPPAPHYHQQHQQRSHRGPPPPAAARQEIAHARRSISPERGGGGRDEFGRRPSSYDRPRRGHEGDRRSRGEGDHRRRYDDRRSSPPHAYRREGPPPEERRRSREGGRSRYSNTEGDDRRGAISHRRPRSRSRSPPPRRVPRRRSSSSSSQSSRSGSRGRSRRGRSRGSSHD